MTPTTDLSTIIARIQERKAEWEEVYNDCEPNHSDLSIRSAAYDVQADAIAVLAELEHILTFFEPQPQQDGK